jgi:hypothetical protein
MNVLNVFVITNYFSFIAAMLSEDLVTAGCGMLLCADWQTAVDILKDCNAFMFRVM